MKRPSTQTILKVALLAVLAVNVKLPKSVHESMLSSRAEAGRGRGAPTPDIPDDDDPEALPADDSAPIRVDSDNFYTVCGSTFNFRFSEVREKNVYKTEIVATDTKNSSRVGRRIYGIRLRDLRNDENAKIDKRGDLASLIEAHYCPSSSSSDGGAVTFGDQSDTPARTSRSPRTPSRTGIDLCLKKSSGATMNEDEQMDCNQRLLDEVDALDSDTPSREKSAALKKFQEAVARMIKIVKKGLLSEDDDTIDAATSQANELIATIDGMTTTAIKPEARTKLSNQIRAMLVGADTRRKTLAAKEKAADLNEQLRDAYKTYQARDAEVRQLRLSPDAATNTIMQRQLMQQSSTDLLNLYQQHNQLVQGLDQSMAQNLANMRNMQIRGLLSASDMSTWMSPYQSLQKSLAQMINPSAMGLSGVQWMPQDPFYPASSNSLNLALLSGTGSTDTIRAAILQQNTQNAGNMLSYSPQQLNYYGLSTGALLGQQFGGPQTLGGTTVNLGGPQQINSFGINNGTGIYSNNGALGNGINNGGLNNGQQMGVGAIGPVNGGATFGNSNMMGFRQVR